MPLTNSGRDFLATAILGQSATYFDSANAYIGVGDGTTAFTQSQTDLQGGQKIRKPMDATYPQITGNTLTFQSTFGSDEANFNWEEWAVFNAASGGVMLNRKVEYNGVKLQGQTWVFQTQLTVLIGA